MSETEKYWEFQYQLVRQSREVLLHYCKSISNEDFLSRNKSFGRGGSIRNLLVHIINTYQFWIIKHALKKDINFTAYEDINTIDEIMTLFCLIDEAMFLFFNNFEISKFSIIELIIEGNSRQLSTVQLFTHVITHEFHHKGQILSLSRQLGYLPIDTDIIR